MGGRPAGKRGSYGPASRERNRKLGTTWQRRHRNATADAIGTKLTEIAKANGIEAPVFPGHGTLRRAYSYVDGGRTRYLEYLAHAVRDGNQVAIQWWSVFEHLAPYQQEDVPFDDVCVAAGVSPSDLMGVIVSTGMKHEMEVSDIAASALLPGVVHQMAKSARRIGGAHAEVAHKDRIAFLQHHKFVPLPRGTVVTVNASANANAKAAAAASSEPSVPSFVEDMGSLQGPKSDVQAALEGVVEGESSAD